MITNTTDKELQNRLRAQDGGGDQAEPRNRSVRRAPDQQRNLRTGEGLGNLATPAAENEDAHVDLLSRPNVPEAEDTREPGGGLEDDDRPLDGDDDDEDALIENFINEMTLESEDESDIESIFYAPSEDENEIDEYPARPTTMAQKTKAMEEGPKPGRKVASLNMRGRTITTGGPKNKDKFQLIVKWMKNEEISVLALIDTHWNEEMESAYRVKYPQLKIYCTHESTNRGGIAFIINETKEAPTDTAFKPLQPGRSALIRVRYEEQSILMATVYVPNEKRDKISTIKTLRKNLEKVENRSEMILTGDFNMVESEIDRHPQHPDDRAIVSEIVKLKASLDMTDGWRNANGEDVKFTWKGSTTDDHSFARIDRIYVTNRLLQFTNEWDIQTTEDGVSDHAAVTVKILEPDPPFIGRGEWRLNAKVLDHPHFKAEATRILQKAKASLDSYRNIYRRKPGNERRNTNIRKQANPQTIWTEYKEGIKRSAEITQKIVRKAIMKKRRPLEGQKKSTEARLRDTVRDETGKILRNDLDNIEKALSDMIKENREKSEATVAARWFKEDERGSKMWYRLNKDRQRRQIFTSLFETTGEETRNTERMLNIAKEHHEQLQARPEMTPERRQAIDRILRNVSKKVNREQTRLLDKKISYGEVRKTVTDMPCGKSPGCDGIPYEFWKQEMDWFKEQQKGEEPRIDIIEIMRTVFADIEEFGPVDLNFAAARMSLLYKKKDRRNIENYRPITLLNTDYKVYTTILTSRLKTVAPNIIHPDQAGFMPKRSIYDQTKMTELTIKLCENEGRNGAIIGLDQEKAYDRIDHDYMWKVMKSYGIPEGFTKRIKLIYSSAQTAIRLNGCTTDSFWILRGVRQGDPLSCLLYNIAIEPLFETIRRSNLSGIFIHNKTQNARVSAYADDTTAFLSENDDYDTLERCINLFCLASTAKFNEAKTEIIPVGTAEFRDEMLRTRIVCGKLIPEGVKIAQDGEAVRMLGAWQGNGVNAAAKWDEILEKQLRIMKRWANSYPSILARARVAKALVVSRALYLMTVNGIPKPHLEQMEKNIRSFIWQGKRGSIAWERTIQHRDEGGIGAPSVKVLYEATKVMWVKRWLTPDENRPKWAWAANAILESCKQESPRVDEDAITEWIEQRWRVKLRTPKMPESMSKMMYAAQKYNVKISILRAPTTLKLSMPAFFHPAINQKRINNSRASRCLRQVHKIETIGELLDFSTADENPMDERCQQTWRQCKQHAKKLIRLLPDLWNPMTTTPAQSTLYHTPRRIAKYNDADIRYVPIAFNPDINASIKILENVRIFGTREGYKTKAINQCTPEQPARIRELRPHGTPKAPGKIEIYTDGSTKRNGWQNSTAGIGNWHAEGSDRNMALKLAGTSQTNQRAELAAIALALQVNGNDDLLIYSDSLTSLNAIHYYIAKWEDIGWHKVKNADLLMEILSLLRTRPSVCEFKWVKAHAVNIGNNHADRLAEEGRAGDDTYMTTVTTPENTRELYDGARLSSLKMREIYSILLQRLTKGKNTPKHPEYVEDAQDMIERETGLRPTIDALINGIWKIKSYTRLRDHLWNMLLGRLKCGAYWRHIPEFEDRAYCSFCTLNGERETEESEQHLWLDCQYNGQTQAWETAKLIWTRTTTQQWPHLSIGLLRGIGTVTLTDSEGVPTRDMSSERLRVIISMTIWAIWKNRNNYAIQNRPVALSDASNLLIESLKDLITKSCNALKFETDRQREKKRSRLMKLWAHGTIVNLEMGQAPTFNF